MDRLHDTFGQWLQHRRKALYLTQQQLARLASCSESTIRKLEADERRPSPEIVNLLISALQIETGDHATFRRFARGDAAELPELPLSPFVPPPAELARTSLPVPRTELIGREQEVSLARRMLEHGTARLVTLTGVGGIGKTRLALEVAHDLAGAFAHGVTFVDLSAIGDAAFVVGALAASLRVREAVGQSLEEAVTGFLAHKQLLLVLDNFEQVVAAAPLLDRLLMAAPRVRMLVTSRVVLGVYGEHVLQVPPLELPLIASAPADASEQVLLSSEAVQLFVERARAVDTAFVLTSENAPAVAEICRQLEGIPLAIELAASRLRVLPPGALLRRLSDRLTVLVGGSRTAPARQRTLRDTIGWSYDLLTPMEQVVFRQLGVFVGGWTLEAAAAVCLPFETAGLDVVDAMDGLVAQSLARQMPGVEGEPRYTMLVTIHDFALEQLEASGEARAVRDRHLGFFCQLAEEAEPHLRTSAQLIWCDRLAADEDNLRAALTWSLEGGARENGIRLAMGLIMFWTIRPHFREGFRWWQRLLEGQETWSPVLAATAFSRAAWYAWFSGHHDQVVTHCETAMAQSQAIADRLSQIIALHLLALMAHDLSQRLDLIEQELQLGRELGDSWWLAVGFWNRGLALRGHDDAGARAAFEASANLFRSTGEAWGLLWVLSEVALLTHRAGRYDEAEALLEESVALARHLGDTVSVANIVGLQGRVALSRGDVDQARHLLTESVNVLKEAGHQPVMLIMMSDLARVALAQGQVEQAAALVDDVINGSRALGREDGVVPFLPLAGAIARAQGQPGRALVLLRQCLAHARGTDVSLVVEAIEQLAGVLGESHAAEAAGQLWGATSAARAARGWPMPSLVQAGYAHDVSVARTRAGVARWETAWSEGQEMTLEQAVTFALDTTS